MKKLLVLAVLAGFGSSVVAEPVTVLSVEGKTLNYVAKAEKNDDGKIVLTPGELFVGERIVQQGDTSCFKETSTLLKMDTVETSDSLKIQIPETALRRDKVSCPA